MNIDPTDPNWKDFNYYYNLDTKIQDNYLSNIKMQMVEQHQKMQEFELKQLFEFLENWKSKYDVFCHEFRCYSYYANQDMIWDREYDNNPFRYLEIPKREVYIDDFFNMILNRSAKFEFEYYREPYDYNNDIKQRMTIKSNQFILSRKQGGYALDVNGKLNLALIVSLIATISDNYVVFDLMRNKRFNDFITNLTNRNSHVEFCFDSNRIKTILISNILIETSRYNKYSTPNFIYFSNMKDETFSIEYKNGSSKPQFGYPHLDEIFGNNRTKVLTEEDLQLYSITHGGKKPILYDFEF